MTNLVPGGAWLGVGVPGGQHCLRRSQPWGDRQVRNQPGGSVSTVCFVGTSGDPRHFLTGHVNGLQPRAGDLTDGSIPGGGGGRGRGRGEKTQHLGALVLGSSIEPPTSPVRYDLRDTDFQDGKTESLAACWPSSRDLTWMLPVTTSPFQMTVASRQRGHYSLLSNGGLFFLMFCSYRSVFMPETHEGRYFQGNLGLVLGASVMKRSVCTLGFCIYVFDPKMP